jgi:chorismate mutase-like protein
LSLSELAEAPDALRLTAETGDSLPPLLASLRAKIDALDKELLLLLNRRAQLAVEVGEVKGSVGAMVHDAAREQEVLEQVRQANPGPLDEHAVTKLFRLIICESRRVESRFLNSSIRRAERFRAMKNSLS